MSLIQVSDVVVPSVFTKYVNQKTEEKSRLIASGALAPDAALNALLAGGGLTFNVPSWKDLTNDDENVSTDTEYDYDGSDNSSPKKFGTSQEVAVRLSRNQSWSSSDLAAALAGSDPAMAIGDNVAGYWARRLQANFVATIKGVFADNAAAPSGSEHTQNDMTNDISGAGYTAGVTDFSAEAFLDAALTMGDSQEELGLVMVHSVVYNRMQKNNLIDFIPDSNGVVNIPTFLGRRVVVDDGMPRTSSVYDTWIFGAGAVRLGVGTAKVATEVERKPEAGNGGGQEILYSRVVWTIHPVGMKYAGTAPSGGPSVASTSNNLAHAGSWMRVFPERKQIRIARLITREA
jgi:hypothetical protein